MKPETFDVVSTREFEAPVTQVWRAWNDPDYVTRWWGPAGFTSPSANLDFRIGGTSLVCMRAPTEYGGQDMYNTWTYRRIEPMTLIEFDNRFTDQAGASIPPPPGVPSVVRHLITFTLRCCRSDIDDGHRVRVPGRAGARPIQSRAGAMPGQDGGIARAVTAHI